MIPGALTPTRALYNRTLYFSSSGEEKIILPFSAGQSALAVDGVAESVDDAAQQLHTNGNVDDGASTLNDIAFFDEFVVTKDDDTDIVGFQVEGHSLSIDF